MALGIDLNNAQFRQFVDFAAQAHKSGSDSKIAQIGTAGQGVDGANPLAAPSPRPRSSTTARTPSRPQPDAVPV